MNRRIPDVLVTMIWMVLGLSCQPVETNPSVESRPVVEAYLAPGQGASMRVSRQTVFATGDSISPILGLKPTLFANGEPYSMVEEPTDSTYRASLELKAGDIYQVQFEYAGLSITSSTTIPEPPRNTSVSDSVLVIPPINSSAPGSIPTFPDPISVTWDNPDGSYYLVVAQNVEENPSSINSGRFGQAFTFRSNPIQTNTFQLNARQFQYYGKHWIILFRINDEYVSLYQDNGSSSLTLKIPYTNISNGLGIFTGINADTVLLNVKRP